MQICVLFESIWYWNKKKQNCSLIKTKTFKSILKTLKAKFFAEFEKNLKIKLKLNLESTHGIEAMPLG